MEMTFRWYGSKFDTVTLEQIRQIPGVTGVITTLYDTTPGEVWTREAIHALKEEVEASGLHISGIESVNIHDAIKIGSPDREQYIDNYIETLKHLGEEDIHLVCYNFMPVFDWTRSDLAKVRPDGSTVLAYDQKEIDKLDPPLDLKEMLVLAVATSIDALAVGITFAFLNYPIGEAVTIIGLTTFCISIGGVYVGNFFGNRYKKKAELAGGIILVLIGVKILLEHLGFVG